MLGKNSRLTFALLILFSVATGAAVSAQPPPRARPDLERLLAPGMTVWITEAGGSREKTRIVGVSGEVVTTSNGESVRRLDPADITRVEVRKSDSLLNGALIGAGAAVASGLFLCTRTEPWENCRDDVGPMLRIGAIGAAAGIGIDALIRGRRTIYESDRGAARLRLAPLLGRQTKGLQLSLAF